MRVVVLVFVILLLTSGEISAGVTKYILKGGKTVLKEKKVEEVLSFIKKINLKSEGKLFNKRFIFLKRIDRNSFVFSSKLIFKSLRSAFDKGSFTEKTFRLGGKDIKIYLPNSLVNLNKVLSKSQLHREVFLRLPDVGRVRAKHIDNIVGKINESIMVKFFKSSGWERIEGEIGRNGIDGLFVKRDKHGNIIDVLIAEAKYNKSQLTNTNCGKQMSKVWLLCKIQELQKEYPNSKEYRQIEKFIKDDIYRAVVWNMTIKDNRMILSLKKIQSKGNRDVSLSVESIREIDLLSPKNSFEKRMTSLYESELKKVGVIYK